MAIGHIFLTKDGPTALASLLIGAFFLFGSLLFVGEVLDADHSLHWPTAHGIVEAHEVETGCGSSSLYRIRLTYRYSAAGAERTGHRIAAMDRFCFHTRQGAEAFLSRSYPIGAVVDVYFDPADPDSALLRPGPYPKAGYVIFGAGCILGAVLLGAGVVLLRRALAPPLSSDRDPGTRTRPIRITARVSLRWRRTKQPPTEPRDPR